MRDSQQVGQIECAVGGSVPLPDALAASVQSSAEGTRTAAAWFCIQHHSGFGPQVRLELRRAGFEVHWPRFVHRIPRKDDVLRPLFPGYMFASGSAHWGSILRIPRVVDIVGRREQSRPAIVPSGMVEALIRRAGAIDLPIDDTPDGRALAIKRRMEAGPVRIIGGPLEGLEGALRVDNGEERVRVLLQIMGAEREVAVSRSLVEPVA